MRTRAERRHHAARIKRKVRRYFVCAESLMSGQYRPTDDPYRIGRAARTRYPCSDYCCGNPRRHWGERTVQERRALLPVED